MYVMYVCYVRMYVVCVCLCMYACCVCPLCVYGMYGCMIGYVWVGMRVRLCMFVMRVCFV